MKRALILPCILLAAVMSFAACASAADKVPLEFWMYHSEGSTSSDALLAAVDDYNNGDHMATVEVQYIPRNDLLKKYALGAVSGELPDIAMVDNPDSATYAAMGDFIDLTDYLADYEYKDFVEGPLASGVYEGKNYSLPYHSNCLGFWINNKMWTDAGLDLNDLPETWDELLADLAVLKESLPSTTYAYAMCCIKTEEGTFQYIPYLYSAGGTVETMASEGAVKSLGLLSTLVNEGYMSAECLNWTQNDVAAQFIAGNAATMMNGSWHLATLARDAADLEFTIIRIPMDQVHASCMGGENIAICSTCENVDAAWDFVSWFLGAEAGLKNNQVAGTIYPHTSIAGADQYPDNEKMQLFIEILQDAVPRGPSPKWGQLSTEIQEAIQAVITNAKTPEEAAADCGAAIDKIIG